MRFVGFFAAIVAPQTRTTATTHARALIVTLNWCAASRTLQRVLLMIDSVPIFAALVMLTGNTCMNRSVAEVAPRLIATLANSPIDFIRSPL